MEIRGWVRIRMPRAAGRTCMLFATDLDVILTDGIDVKNVKSGGCQSVLKVTKGWAIWQ